MAEIAPGTQPSLSFYNKQSAHSTDCLAFSGAHSTVVKKCQSYKLKYSIGSISLKLAPGNNPWWAELYNCLAQISILCDAHFVWYWNRKINIANFISQIYLAKLNVKLGLKANVFCDLMWLYQSIPSWLLKDEERNSRPFVPKTNQV